MNIFGLELGYEKPSDANEVDIDAHFNFSSKGNKNSYDIASGGGGASTLFGSDSKIFGLPFKYSELADKGNRVCQNTFEADTTCVAFITFGTANLNKNLYGKMRLDTLGDENNYISTGITESIAAAISATGIKGLLTGSNELKDMKLLSFKPNMGIFKQYLYTTISQTARFLDIPAGDLGDVTVGNMLAFWTMETGGMNEEISNEYTTPDVIDQMNSEAIKKRENYQLYGAMGDVNTKGTTTAFLQNMATGIAEDIGLKIASGDSFFGSYIGTIASVFGTVNKGSMGYYAKIWADSKNNTQYTLQFKFRSPYGNKYDIFRNVLYPFLILYTAALPRQDGHFSYKEPFLCQVYFPGWFLVHCGVISNLSWVKGGDNQLWSVDGLPLEITVTMQIEDLYPIQMSSVDEGYLHYNLGLLSFLESLTGTSADDINAISFFASHRADDSKSFLEQVEETTGSPMSIFKTFTQAAFKDYIEEAKSFS